MRTCHLTYEIANGSRGYGCIMSIEVLLAKTAAISDKYDLIYQKTGGYFNIFNITNIEENEVKICRVIYELIDPKGCHYQGDTYLRLFVKHVLKIDLEEQEYKTVRVYREYLIPNDRRIDLVIETDRRFIPIEVKINASDERNQCYDYYQKAINSKLFYLTLYGNIPSPESAANLTPIIDNSYKITGYKEIIQISFSHEIINWLSTCLVQPETVRIAPIREVLVQLIGTLRKLTNQMEEGKEMEIVNILTSSKSNMKSTIEIEKTLKKCKQETIRKVLKAIENGIDKDKLVNKYDFEFDNGALITNYYEKKGSPILV